MVNTSLLTENMLAPSSSSSGPAAASSSDKHLDGNRNQSSNKKDECPDMNKSNSNEISQGAVDEVSTVVTNSKSSGDGETVSSSGTGTDDRKSGEVGPSVSTASEKLLPPMTRAPAEANSSPHPAATTAATPSLSLLTTAAVGRVANSECGASTLASTTGTINEQLSSSIRTSVKRKLDSKTDARKIRTISTKGKSIKFPVKLMYVLEDEAKQYEHIISWSKDGLSFIIHDTSQLEKEVLPNIFKDAKFSSFLRKLYRWGFIKRPLKDNACAYINPKFHKGNYSLCMDMSCSSTTITPSIRQPYRPNDDYSNVTSDSGLSNTTGSTSGSAVTMEMLSQFNQLRQAQMFQQHQQQQYHQQQHHQQQHHQQQHHQQQHHQQHAYSSLLNRNDASTTTNTTNPSSNSSNNISSLLGANVRNHNNIASQTALLDNNTSASKAWLKKSANTTVNTDGVSPPSYEQRPTATATGTNNITSSPSNVTGNVGMDTSSALQRGSNDNSSRNNNANSNSGAANNKENLLLALLHQQQRQQIHHPPQHQHAQVNDNNISSTPVDSSDATNHLLTLLAQKASTPNYGGSQNNALMTSLLERTSNSSTAMPGNNPLLSPLRNQATNNPMQNNGANNMLALLSAVLDQSNNNSLSNTRPQSNNSLLSALIGQTTNPVLNNGGNNNIALLSTLLQHELNNNNLPESSGSSNNNEMTELLTHALQVQLNAAREQEEYHKNQLAQQALNTILMQQSLGNMSGTSSIHQGQQTNLSMGAPLNLSAINGNNLQRQAGQMEYDGGGGVGMARRTNAADDGSDSRNTSTPFGHNFMFRRGGNY